MYTEVTEQGNSQRIYCVFDTLVWQMFIRSENKKMSEGQTCKDAYWRMVNSFFLLLYYFVLLPLKMGQNI